MKFKNILNKPYKYGFLSKINNYNYIFNNYLNIILPRPLLRKKIEQNFLYNSPPFLNKFSSNLDFILLKLGICKTIKQSRYIINYGKLLINGTLIKKYNFKIKNFNVIKILPILYLHILNINLFLFKNYLKKYNYINDIMQYNIININKYIIYL